LNQFQVVLQMTNHLRCMQLLQRRCKRGKVALQNSAIFGRKRFKQSHSKHHFETVCGKLNLTTLLPSLTCLLRLYTVSHCPVLSVRQSVPLVHFIALKIISDRPWPNVGWILVVH